MFSLTEKFPRLSYFEKIGRDGRLFAASMALYATNQPLDAAAHKSRDCTALSGAQGRDSDPIIKQINSFHFSSSPTNTSQ